MSYLARFKLFLWVFGHFKVRLIGYTRPKLLALTESLIVVKIPLRKRTKNHLNSMYFGALAIGADIAGGLHGFYHSEKQKVKSSIVFKSFQAEFIKRPESDVYFVSDMGHNVKQMIEDSKHAGRRMNQPIAITAYTHYFDPDKKEVVANMTLELSIKVIS